MEKKKHKGVKITLAAVLAFLVLLAVVYFVYTAAYYPPSGPALEAIAEAGPALTETNGYIATGSPAAQTGYIFYPGGKVEAGAYLPYLLQLSAAGDVFCAVVKPPFRLAIFDENAAAGVMAAYPGVQRWFVGGHSLGGVAAAGFAAKHPVAGLVLLAAYPVADLSETTLPVLSVVGTQDTVLNRQKYEEARTLLPPGTRFLTIEGGNHGQMGDYGPQKGDGEAALSPEAQRQQLVEVTLALMQAA